MSRLHAWPCAATSRHGSLRSYRKLKGGLTESARERLPRQWLARRRCVTPCHDIPCARSDAMRPPSCCAPPAGPAPDRSLLRSRRVRPSVPNQRSWLRRKPHVPLDSTTAQQLLGAGQELFQGLGFMFQGLRLTADPRAKRVTQGLVRWVSSARARAALMWKEHCRELCCRK